MAEGKTTSHPTFFFLKSIIFREEIKEWKSHPEGLGQCYVYILTRTCSYMEMIPTFLLLPQPVCMRKHCRRCLPFFLSLSLESTFPACEGGFAGIPLSVCKWKQSLSSESSIFVITLVTVTVAHQ